MIYKMLLHREGIWWQHPSQSWAHACDQQITRRLTSSNISKTGHEQSLWPSQLAFPPQDPNGLWVPRTLGSSYPTMFSTVFYMIIINGKLTESFKLQHGLMEGDPLSPYIFLLCMDILSCMTRLATNINLFGGIPLHRGDHLISHLFFDDDSLLFFNASNTTYQAREVLLHIRTSYHLAQVNCQVQS